MSRRTGRGPLIEEPLDDFTGELHWPAQTGGCARSVDGEHEPGADGRCRLCGLDPLRINRASVSAWRAA